jgi:hypothetical protein
MQLVIEKDDFLQYPFRIKKSMNDFLIRLLIPISFEVFSSKYFSSSAFKSMEFRFRYAFFYFIIFFSTFLFIFFFENFDNQVEKRMWEPQK